MALSNGLARKMYTRALASFPSHQKLVIALKSGFALLLDHKKHSWLLDDIQARSRELRVADSDSDEGDEGDRESGDRESGDEEPDKNHADVTMRITNDCARENDRKKQIIVDLSLIEQCIATLQERVCSMRKTLALL